MGQDKTKKKLKQYKAGGIKIGCWNKGGALQPLKGKITEIEHLIKENNFGVFGVIEANLFKDDNKKEIDISGYTVFWDKGRNQPSRQNVRCVVYVRNDLSFKLKVDLMNEKVPEVWLEIGEPNKKRVLMCIFYREFSEWNSRVTTNSIKSQKERFQEWLSKVGALAEQTLTWSSAEKMTIVMTENVLQFLPMKNFWKEEWSS